MQATIETMFANALNNHRTGRIDAAKSLYRKILETHPNHADTLQLLGAALVQSHDFQEAIDVLQSATQLNTNDPSIWNNLGLACKGVNRVEESILYFNRALSLYPSYATAYSNLGSAYGQIKKLDDAIQCYRKALQIQPNFLDAHLNKITLLIQIEKIEEAYQSCQKALQILPNNAQLLTKLGDCLFRKNKIDRAIENYIQAVTIQPNNKEASLALANAYLHVKKYTECREILSKILITHKNEYQAYYILGKLYSELNNHQYAIRNFEIAAELSPRDSSIHMQLGYAYFAAANFEEAEKAFSQSYNLNPQQKYLAGMLLHTQLMNCNWTHYADELAVITASIHSEKPVISPFPALSLIEDGKTLLQATRLYSNMKYPSSARNVSPVKPTKKIKIAYFSPDLRAHAVGYLTHQIFDLHNKDEFEVVAVIWKIDENDSIYTKIRSFCDDIIDITTMPDTDAIEFLKSKKFHIAIDLTGYTQNCRPAIFAERVAPIQINYLGYPGSMGSNNHDYIIGDEVVTPISAAGIYSEKIVQIPCCFQANSLREISNETEANRHRYGLPEDAIVFCAFNSTYKISPKIFNAWMNILLETPRSVLWLLSENQEATQKIIQQANRCGVADDRIIFAKRAPYSEHMKRYGLADLFLDTSPYNAGTTSSDALWMGLPVLTLMGETFASRMAASILSAANLPELVTTSITQYKETAIRLGSNHKQLKEIRKRLLVKRHELPLFDIQKFVTHLEAVYKKIWNLHLNGEPLQHIIAHEIH